MEKVTIKTVGVIGAGTMGSGIAQGFLQNNFEVSLFDVSDSVLVQGENHIRRGLERARKPDAISLLKQTTDLHALSSCDFVVEAATENIEVKQDIFKKLDRSLAPPHVLATNTSSLAVSEIASAVKNPERVVGMHFFNPAPIMRLVEVVRAERTSESTVETVMALARRLGKTPVRCKDTPGFIANRVARPFYLEAMRLLEAGAGTPEDIDIAMHEKGGFRMGPFQLMDLIGLDVNLAISKIVHQRMGTPERLQPNRVQQELVAQGCFGRKSSRGFYIYQNGKPGQINPLLQNILPQMGSKPLAADAMLHSVWEAVIAEARKAAGEGVATPEDIDMAMRLGMNWPKGPFELVSGRG